MFFLLAKLLHIEMPVSQCRPRLVKDEITVLLSSLVPGQREIAKTSVMAHFHNFGHLEPDVYGRK